MSVMEMSEPTRKSISSKSTSSKANYSYLEPGVSGGGEEPLLPSFEDEIPISPSRMIIKSKPRIISLDQFRGYTMFAMVFVNYIGDYTKRSGGHIPNNFAHVGTYTNYPDTIMPHFIYMAGFTLRLSVMKFIQQDSEGYKPKMFWKTLQRFLGLIVLSCIFYTLVDGDKFDTWDQMQNKGFKQGMKDFFVSDFWETLTQIAFSMLFIAPIIHRAWQSRVIFMFLTLPLPPILYIVIYKNADFNLANNPAGDGGCLAWMGSWSFVMLLGGLTYDIISWTDRDTANFNFLQLFPCLNSETVSLENQKLRFMNMVAWPLMISGYLLSLLASVLHFDVCASTNSRGLRSVPSQSVPCEGFVWYQAPPFFPPNNPVTMWTMQPHFPAMSSILFTAGFSLFLYSVSFYIWDSKHYRTIPLFTTFGTNSLLTYVTSLVVGILSLSKQICPKDAPAAYVLLVGFPIHLFLIWIIVHYFEKNKFFIAL